MSQLRLQPELEDLLRTLPGVQAVSVVTDADAVPTEIHVLAEPGKPAKQIARDVQSAAIARFDLQVDHRIVSVVQLGETQMAEAGLSVVTTDDVAVDGAPRPIVTRIGVSSGMQDSTATVVLHMDGEEFEGEARGMSATVARPRLVARATVAALGILLGSACEIESAQLVSAGERQVALVVLTLDRPGSGAQVLTGSAVVRMHTEDAVARAVLDGLNRHLAG